MAREQTLAQPLIEGIEVNAVAEPAKWRGGRMRARAARPDRVTLSAEARNQDAAALFQLFAVRRGTRCEQQNGRADAGFTDRHCQFSAIAIQAAAMAAIRADTTIAGQAGPSAYAVGGYMAMPQVTERTAPRIDCSKFRDAKCHRCPVSPLMRINMPPPGIYGGRPLAPPMKRPDRQADEEK